MKIKINKNLKLGLIFIMVILISIISFIMFRLIKYPGFEEKKVSLFSYTNKSYVDYVVFLKPNLLYEQKVLGEDEIYITEFIDKINATFYYKYTGERIADINGDYEIIARVEGTVIRDKDEQVIWKKDFQLLPKENFNTKDKTVSIRKAVEFDLYTYNEFARQVIEASKVNANTRLRIIMNVNIQGETDKGVIKDNITPSMIIPLNTSYFYITGNLSEEKSGSIEGTIQIQLPTNKKQVLFYGVIIGILSLLLISIVTFTESASIKDPLEKKLKQIIKKHGDRLVALNNEISIASESCSKVKSIDDLVRIADEIGKPIMYRYSRDYKNISSFYVFDDNRVYCHDLVEALIIEEKKELEKEINKNTKIVKKEQFETKIES